MDATAAILLRKTRLTETSLIVTWLTDSHGRIKTVAKGALRSGSRLAGVLDLFFECEITFARSRKSELHTLQDAVLRTAHEQLRTDYLRVAVASYFVELLELVTEPEHSVPELYDLLQRGLRYLNGTQADVRGLHHFEAELARLLGVANAAVSPAVAIGRAYHRLPAARAALLKRLG